jgi:dienelactone hydrolase
MLDHADSTLRFAAIRRLFPKRQPVAPRVRRLGVEVTDFGERRLIEYAVEPGERVTAYLLVPANLLATPSPRRRGTPRRSAPAIIAAHQHNGEFHLGKSEPAGLRGPAMYHYGVDLCRCGFVVLCPDQLAFEQRVTRPRRPGSSLPPVLDQKFEAFSLGDQLLRGRSLAVKYVFDLCQAIDTLESIDLVDPRRMGIFGHSLGGQCAMWLAFYDRRIRAAFSSCGFSTLGAVQRDQIPHNLASYLPGLLAVGDVDDAVAAIAPRAFGMSHGRRDPIFPLDGVRSIHRAARRAFPRDKLLTILFDGPHALPADVKRRAYAFLEQQLGPATSR